MTDIHENGTAPSQFLVENAALLPQGRALDVAMGSGRNAIYLAGMGFDVEGVDISPEAVNEALGYDVLVPDDPLISGALGAALLGKELTLKALAKGETIQKRKRRLGEVTFFE